MSELSPCHVRSGRIMTVDGPIPSSALGHTLMHEHLQNDCRCWWNPPQEPERQYLAERRSASRSCPNSGRTRS